MTQRPMLNQAMPIEWEPSKWLSRLIDAVTPSEVGEVIVAMAESLPGCETASLRWSHDDDVPPQYPVVIAVGSAEAQTTQIDDEFFLDDDGLRLVWRLLSREDAFLLLQFSDRQLAQPLRDVLVLYFEPARKRLMQALNLVHLHDSHQQLERSESLQRALFAITDLAGSALDMPEMLRSIHAVVSTLMYSENFFIVRHDPEHRTLRFLYYADVENKQIPDADIESPLESRRGTLTWHLLTGGKPLIGNREEMRGQVSGPLISSGPRSHHWLGVPMLLDHQVRGAVVVQSYREDIVYTHEDRALLQFVASHILTALERKQSKDELERRVRVRTLELAEANRVLQQEIVEREHAEKLQATLFQLAQLATSDIDENQFYERVHAGVGALLNAENFFIALLSEDRATLDFPYYVDSHVRSMPARPLSRGLSEYVLRKAEPLLAQRSDIDALSRNGEVVPRHVGQPAMCWLGVPLLVDDEVIGLVSVQSLVEEVAYDAADQALLSFVALQIANSIYRRRTAISLHQANMQLEQRVDERTWELRQQIAQREQVQGQLEHQVMHDTLTGLPNRIFLRKRLDLTLKQLRREPVQLCALLYLDIDRFKVINDSLGHLAGDQFLRAIARRLQHCVRHPDVVVRLSGDEFAILLEDVSLPGSAVKVAQRILHELGAPLHLAGKELKPSASMGIAIGDSCHLKSDDLLRDADIALYRAKERGRNRFEMFDETLARDIVDVLTLEGELRHALLHDEFEPYFQPVCRIAQGDTVGYEALIRWNHPRRGVLGPPDFVKIAEDSGLIETIDWRMFELSCNRLLEQEAGDTFVTINVSARHLRHEDFDSRLLALLERSGLPPRRLIVEVTEGALLDNPELVRDTLGRLRSAGVGAALDDFGTGFSSLSYLHSLPLRILKIDKAFVQELDKQSSANSATVVAAILALARALNIQVIAEGIETVRQRQALLTMGCEMGQGYLLGRPAPIKGRDAVDGE